MAAWSRPVPALPRRSHVAAPASAPAWACALRPGSSRHAVGRPVEANAASETRGRRAEGEGSPPGERPRRGRVVTAQDREDWAMCMGLVRRRGVPSSDAGDIASRVFYTLRHREAVLGAAGAEPSGGRRFALCWGIARVLVLRYRSERHRASERQASAELGSICGLLPQKSPEDMAADHLACDKVLSELRRRRPVHHAIFVAFDVEGRSMPEIAAGLGLHANTAWTRLTAARIEVRRIARIMGIAKNEGG